MSSRTARRGRIRGGLSKVAMWLGLAVIAKAVLISAAESSRRRTDQWLTAGTVGAAGHNLMMAENEELKIRFRLQQDAVGYPPCDSEGLWATPLGGGAYRVANLPWFVPDVALDDVVRVVPDRDGTLWAVERIEESGNCTIRVAPLDVDQRTVFDTFGAMGIFGEGYGDGINILALNIPPDAEFGRIKTALQQGEADGRWAYEEGSITPAWASA